MLKLHDKVKLHHNYTFWYIPCEKHGCMITKPAIDAEIIIGKYSVLLKTKIIHLLKSNAPPPQKKEKDKKIQAQS